MSQWEFLPNPAYAGQEPHPLEATCHDGTPFLTVQCAACRSFTMHIHESQLGPIGADAEIATRCHGCDELLVFPPGALQQGFAAMRAAGWIA